MVRKTTQSLRYNHIILGGTFDHLHAGHKVFIQHALKYGKRVTIGITADAMNTHKHYAHHILPFAQRLQTLEKFLKEIHASDICTCIQITDLYGTAVTDNTIDAIVVTKQTQNGATRINRKRNTLSLPPLPILVSPLFWCDKNTILSSSLIREGRANRDGMLYESLFHTAITITPNQRRLLSEPLGTPTHTVPQPSNDPILLIGDVTSEYFQTHHHPFTCGYVDGMSKRVPFSSQCVRTQTSLSNPHGTIQPEIFRHLLSTGLQSSNTVFQITGEEDLCAVPAVLLSPLGSQVWYGQASLNSMIRVDVTEEKKEFLKNLLIPQISE